ncbi:MAG TPA: NPCBM/NEW2 domain-containing protein [Pirellulales bacterium]|nr:NPCBM/NEW2 domain-containing protein [Pirellulales bacterium]
MAALKVLLYLPLILICAASNVWADEAVSDARLLVPINGDRVAATLESISPAGELQFRVGESDRRLRSDELAWWGAPAEPRTDRQLVLADGGIVPLRLNPPPTSAAEQLIAVSDTFGELTLPLKLLAGVIYHAPIDPQRRDELTARLRATDQKGDTPATAKNADRLLLENGDELQGRIVALKETAVEFEADLGALTVEIDRVAALAFNPSLRSLARANGPRSLVGFRDGSILLAKSVRLTDGHTELHLGDESRLSAAEGPVYLQPLGGAIHYLSDLSPASYRQLPFLDLPWEYQLDANVNGTRLRAAGRIYSKGVGMHSAARLTWQLEKNYRRLEAELAIDDQTDGHGSVVFRVFSGPKEIYKSQIVRGGDAPLPISIDVRGARQLSLVVDYADRADVLDHADWLNVRLRP